MQRAATKSTAAVALVLHRSGYRFTPQRQAVVKILYRNQSCYLDSWALYRLIQKEYPAMSLVTVYRTLTLLEDLQLLSVIKGSYQEKRYRLRLPGQPSNELVMVCRRCGRFHI